MLRKPNPKLTKVITKNLSLPIKGSKNSSNIPIMTRHITVITTSANEDITSILYTYLQFLLDVNEFQQ